MMEWIASIGFWAHAVLSLSLGLFLVTAKHGTHMRTLPGALATQSHQFHVFTGLAFMTVATLVAIVSVPSFRLRTKQ